MVVEIVKNEPRAGTWRLSQGFDVEHRALRKLVIKYKSEFEELGIITSQVQKPTGKSGRPVDEFLLNENQSMYLGTLLTNNVTVRKFKLKLIKEFDRMKKEIIRRSMLSENKQWVETRKAGKLVRRNETDTIQRFVAYAKAQGSQNAEMYYANISKMQNKSLFFMEQKFKNLRDILSLEQLSIVIVADRVAANAIEAGMNNAIHYKEIYQLAKHKIEEFAASCGKTLIPAPLKQLTE